MQKYNIVIVGIGYVGTSLAIVLSQKNKVTAVDINKEKIDLLNARKSPIKEKLIESYLAEKDLDLIATTENVNTYKNGDFIILATPTDFNESNHCLDTSILDSLIEKIVHSGTNATIIIKSTVPIGYTRRVREKFQYNHIIFSPEFLREAYSLYDCLHPSRIIVSFDHEEGQDLAKSAKIFAELLVDGAIEKEIPILLTGQEEAESVKLFANSFLAMRVAFFNELDTFSEINGLHTKQILEGVCLDPRIGSDYNNPSFGYGGYCLPKDTRQLFQNFKSKEISQNLIEAIVNSNATRKKYIADRILEMCQILETKGEKVFGVYRLLMKADSEDTRQAVIGDVVSQIKDYFSKVIVYEPILACQSQTDYTCVDDLEEFKKQADLIITNRYSSDLDDIKHKVYTRDIFGKG